MISVYALCHPISGTVLYIGSTRLSVRRRYDAHLCKARSGGKAPLYKYMRELLPYELSTRVLESTEDARTAKEAERKWILHHAATVTNVRLPR